MKTLMNQAEDDLDSLLKVAASARGIQLEYLKSVIKPMLGTLAAAGATGMVAYHFAKKDKERHQKDLMDSMQSLATKHPDLANKSPEKFFERFGELTVISPTIAKNPSLAGKLLEKKLDSGFSVDDIHKLTSIESNSSRSGISAPIAAGRAGAASALRTLVQTFGHDIIQNHRASTKKFESQMSDFRQKEDDDITASLRAKIEKAIDKQREMNKESSATTVSDECLGAMLAERYVMLKTAGVGDVLTSGMKNIGTSMAYFAPAIALGGGIELVRQAIESRRNAALEAQANKNFKNIMQNSDIAKGNPQHAAEAFDTLKVIAPSLAARPLVASTFIDYVASQGRLAPETIQQLATAENEVRGIGGGGKRGTFFADLKNYMGPMEPEKIEKIRSMSSLHARPKKGYL